MRRPPIALPPTAPTWSLLLGLRLLLLPSPATAILATPLLLLRGRQHHHPRRQHCNGHNLAPRGPAYAAAAATTRARSGDGVGRGGTGAVVLRGGGTAGGGGHRTTAATTRHLRGGVGGGCCAAEWRTAPQPPPPTTTPPPGTWGGMETGCGDSLVSRAARPSQQECRCGPALVDEGHGCMQSLHKGRCTTPLFTAPPHIGALLPPLRPQST